MISFANACIVTAILSWMLATFVLLRAARLRQHYLWCLFCISVGLWSFGLARMVSSPDIPTALMWQSRVHNFGAILIPIFFFHFVALYFDRPLHWHIRIGYSIAILEEFTSLTGHLATVVPLPPFNFYTVPKPMYITFVLYFFYYVAYAHWLLYRKMKTADFNTKNRIKFIYFGTLLGFVGGSTAFLPVFHLPVFPYGVYGVFVYILTVTYAILKMRLMDIELLARDTLTKGLALAVIGLPILVGRMLAIHLISMHGTDLIMRATGTLGLAILSFSLGLSMLRYYADRQAQALTLFLMTLGCWNSCEIILDLRPMVWSVSLFRLSYVFGCGALIYWLRFWEKFIGRSSIMRWLSRSAILMMGFACTPYIVRSLAFDAGGRNPAIEVPGWGLILYGTWFLIALLVAGISVGIHFSRQDTTVPDDSMAWILLAFGLGGIGLASYFGYVEHFFRCPVHPFLGMALCLVMTRHVFKRLGYNAALGLYPSLAAGATSLLYPFIAGAMMTQGPWFQVGAAFLLVLSVPQGLMDIEDSIQAWLDETLFHGRFSARKQMRLARQQSVRLTNLRDLVDTTVSPIVYSLHVKSAALYFHDMTTNSFACVSRIPPFVGDEDTPSYSDGDAFVTSLKISHRLTTVEIEHFAGWSTVVPLVQETGLFGFLLLGETEERTQSFSMETLEVIRQSLESTLTYAYVFYEQSMMLDKFTHDNIRYAGGIRASLKVFMDNCGHLIPAMFKELCIDTIDQQASLLEEYLSDLREIMSVLAQRMQGKYTLASYNMVDVVRAIWPLEKVRAKQKGITLTCNMPVESTDCSPVMAWGAQMSIRHVIENLISNAFKFTPPGGTIRLEIRPLGDKVEIVISDSGPGIPPETLPHIFDLFYQGKGRESMEKSTGLGLSIVKEIVALHKGNIDVISEEGRGTSFFVRLPSSENALIKAA